MTKNQYKKFVKFLLQDNEVFAPVKKNGFLDINKIYSVEEIVLDGRVTEHSFKEIFLPSREDLFQYKNKKIVANKFIYPKVVALGMTVFDLEALNLYNHIFEKDPYYQSRKENILIIGQSSVAKQSLRTFKKYAENFEEDVLEHVEFDIFMEKREDGYRIICGSDKGKKLLEKFGYKNFDYIQFAGPIQEQGLNERMVKISDKMKSGYNPEIWEELGKKCIECGKCTVVCPTCYCFRMDDEPTLEKNCGVRFRCWDSCFFHEFSEVSGGHKFMNTTAERIYFWYYHKFVRIPDRLSIPGCVGCGRCTRVCPAGIDIKETIKKILNS